jgi:hypothetical protein
VRATPKRVGAVVAALLVVLFAAGFLWALASRKGCSPGFDRAAWSRADPDTSKGAQKRHRLADDLVGCGKLAHRSRRSVELLLGPPAARTGDTWTYDLGALATTNTDVLAVRFDRVGRVGGAEIDER